MPRLAAPLRRRRLSLTSLIDVIFLLLLFFMLSTTFTRFGDLPLVAAAGGAMAPDGPPPAFLRVLPDRLVLDTVEVVPEALGPALAARGVRLLILAPAEGVTAQRLVEVLAPLRGLPDLSVRVIGG